MYVIIRLVSGHIHPSVRMLTNHTSATRGKRETPRAVIDAKWQRIPYRGVLVLALEGSVAASCCAFLPSLQLQGSVRGTGSDPDLTRPTTET